MPEEERVEPVAAAASPGSGWILNFGNTAMIEAQQREEHERHERHEAPAQLSRSLNWVTLTLTTMADAVMMMLPFMSA